jgi:hypothetical protein
VAEFVPAFSRAIYNLEGIMAVAQRGIVSGKVTDAQGNPLEGVKIIIDHGLFFNTNLVTSTGADGRYRIRVPNGAWFAFAQISKTYNGNNYTFYLKPDNSDSFGGEGAVRNFVWVLTGKRGKPMADGFIGGTVTFDENPRSRPVADTDDIEFTLTPVGALIDGSTGKVLKLRGQNNDRRLRDIPVGRYDITATYQGDALRLRKWGIQGRSSIGSGWISSRRAAIVSIALSCNISIDFDS